MLKHRFLSGTLLILGFVAAGIYLPALGVWLVLVGVACLAQFEFYRLLTRGGMSVFPYLGLTSGAAMITATFFASCGADGASADLYRWENVVLLFTLTAVFLRQFPRKSGLRPLESLGGTLLGILYVPFFLNYVTRLAFTWEAQSLWEPLRATGLHVVFFYIVVTKAADVGAFFVGSRFGRHKLFPRVSPAKSWEGLAGGIAASMLASWAYAGALGGRLGMLPLHAIDIVCLGILLAVAGVVGDLFESLIKRSIGTKDSSSVIPGMGGILDVLDSLLFGAPVMYLYARVFL